MIGSSNMTAFQKFSLAFDFIGIRNESSKRGRPILNFVHFALFIG
jgi:hypothetical protein